LSDRSPISSSDADRGVVHALGKANLAQGRTALRYADAEADIVAKT
jgi:hypothetical protein